MHTAAYSHYDSYNYISDKSVETAKSHTASCDLEVNQLGVQHEAIFILFLQLYPSATAEQILSSTHRITDLSFYACMCVISSSLMIDILLNSIYFASGLFSSLIHKCLISCQVGSHNHFCYHSISCPTSRKLQ